MSIGHTVQGPDQGSPRRLKRPTRRALAGALVLVALLLIGWGTYREIERVRASQLAAAVLEARLQAQAFAEHADAIVRTVDFALVELTADWTGWPAFHDKARRLSQRLGDLAVQVAGTDDQGVVMSTNLATPTERVSVADREHIRVHLENRVQGLYISDPIFGRVSKQWSIQFTRAIRAGDRVVGVVVISVSPTFFADFYRRLSNQRPGDVISMLKPDGVILARAPDERESMGMRLKGLPDFAGDPAGSGYYMRASIVDGVDRIYGWYRARGSGLVLVSGIDRTVAMAGFQRERIWLVFSAVLGATLLLVLALTVDVLTRRSRRDAARAREENLRLEDAVAERTRELERVIEDLSASRAELLVARSALDSASEGVTIADARGPDYPIIYVNDAFERITGYARADVLGRSCRILQGPERDQPGLEIVRQALRVHQHCRVQLRNYRRDGELFHNELSLSPVRNAAGEVTHYVGLQTDVTQRLAIEAQLRDSQKMEAIGQLTGGLAHDFNNLLGVVIGNLDMIGESLASDEGLRRAYRAALDAALQGAAVTRSLLAVARRQPLQVGVDDLNALVGEMLPLIRSSAGVAVTVRLQLAGEDLPVLMDAGGLSNALLNLVINARDAMKEQPGERLMVVRTRRSTALEDPQGRLDPAAYAVVEVEDNGPGMSDTVSSRAFDLFFTTKSAGHGTGLGLSMVRGFAEQLRGTAYLDSAPGRGTRVALMLPLASAPVLEGAGDGSAGSAPGPDDSALILAAEGSADLDTLAREAARVCAVPSAVLVLTDGRRQQRVAAVGFPDERMPELRGLLARALIRPADVFVVEDVSRDETAAASARGVQASDIRFFAAAPVANDGGRAVGAICVLDREPHALSPLQSSRLRELAGRVRALLARDAGEIAARPAPPVPAPLHGDAPSMDAPAPSARARVLVVDDEKPLCDIGCLWLESMGYDTVGVLGPAEALERLRHGRFDILFTDIVMPGAMDGFELAREARRLQPHLRVLLASGYARGLARQEELPGPLLDKPYRKHELQRMIEALP
jgi:PAS domain S-box-containing protein